MQLDKEERRKRKQQRREHEMLERYLLEHPEEADDYQESEPAGEAGFKAVGMGPIYEQDESEGATREEAMVVSGGLQRVGGEGEREKLPRPHDVAPSKNPTGDEVVPFVAEGQKILCVLCQR
jgi:hypothetical protein